MSALAMAFSLVAVQLPAQAEVRQADVAADVDTALADGATATPGGLERLAVQPPTVGRESHSVDVFTGREEQPVRLTLPGNGRKWNVSQARGLVVLQQARAGFGTAVRAGADGSLRALVHIHTRAAPKSYAFVLDVPEGGELLALEDGGALLRGADGAMLGSFPPPWATDARGRSVTTRYRISGTTLIQDVMITRSTVLPVVADPFWIPALMVFAHVTRHAATQAAARGISQNLIRQVVQNGSRTAGNRGTSVFTQGTGKNRIRVIVDNKSGNIITVTKG